LKPVRKRKLVDEMRIEWDVSIRRACRVCLLDTSTYHYKSRRPGQAGLELRIREICQTRVRYGYRRVHIQLRREGWCHGQNKTRRIYRELGLQLRNKTPKRRVKAKLREDRRPATRSNETWAMDFVHDQLATGRKLRVLTSSIHSHASPRRWNRVSHSAVLMLWRCLKGSAGKWVFRRRFGSIRAPNLSHAIWICGLISVA
jgi:putative transposase